MKSILFNGRPVLNEVTDVVEDSNELIIQISSNISLDEIKKILADNYDTIWRLEMSDNDVSKIYYGYGKIKSVSFDEGTGSNKVVLTKLTDSERDSIVYEQLYDLMNRVSNVAASSQAVDSYADDNMLNIIVNDILGGE